MNRDFVMIRYTVLFIICIFVLASCATRQDLEFIRDRIDGVEAMTVQHKTSVDGIDASLHKEYARISIEMDKLADQIRVLDGKIDEKIYAVEKKTVSSAQLKNELNRLEAICAELSAKYAELDNKLTDFKEETGKLLSEDTGTDGWSADSGKPLPTAEQLYDEALNLLEKNDTRGARDNLLLILKEYPEFARVDNTQFWIGETYYREKWYQKAILEYQKVIENYPKGGKVPAAYLKQGLAFFELKEPDNGRLILNQLIKKYPNSTEAAAAKKKLGK